MKGTGWEICFQSSSLSSLVLSVTVVSLPIVSSHWHSTRLSSSSASDYKPLAVPSLSAPPRLFSMSVWQRAHWPYCTHREARPDTQQWGKPLWRPRAGGGLGCRQTPSLCHMYFIYENTKTSRRTQVWTVVCLCTVAADQTLGHCFFFNVWAQLQIRISWSYLWQLLHSQTFDHTYFGNCFLIERASLIRLVS